MSALSLALEHMRRRKALARRAAQEIARLWARVDRMDIARSWIASLPAVLTILEPAQLLAASAADPYLDDLADVHNVDRAPAGRLRPASLAGVASDGRDLASLMYQPAVSALSAIQGGASVPQAMAAGRLRLDMIARTQVADAGRTADAAALVARAQMAGYVRVLSPPSCSRCVILAGRFYAWNAGFRRHPRCDCVHSPAPSPRQSEALVTQPRAYFDSLSRAEQDQTFTQAGAEAIRLGADPAQVVNARRGAAGLTPAGVRITEAEARAIRDGRDVGRLAAQDVFGRPLFVTTEGTTVRGLAGVRLGAKEAGTRHAGSRYRSARAPRLMPESILQIAGNDRQEALRLLRRFGYIL